MTWKTILIWIAVFCGLGCCFFVFASYLFDKQEDIQLFFPQWDNVLSQLSRPGGFISLSGMWLTQYYCFPLPAALINAFLVAGTGLGGYLLLERTAPRVYNIPLALFLVLGMMKAHIQYNYVADGSIGLLILVWTLYLVSGVQGWKKRLYAATAAVAILYWMTGQAAVLFGLLLLGHGYLNQAEKPWLTFVPLLAGCLLACSGVRFSMMLPLTDGLHGWDYHEMQIQSDSFVYHVWILFSGGLLLLMAVARLLKRLKWQNRTAKSLVTGSIILCLLLFSASLLPDKEYAQNKTMDKLAYLSKRHKWNEIIAMHIGKRIPGPVNRNYLNMALAQRGLLGDRLFFFDQNGSHGLLAPYNMGYQMSVLLSDIHFLAGDVGISESYAMEALVTSRRGGSPQMLRRLVQISLIRQEWELASKYISLLKQMPTYRKWAIRYESFLHHPEKINADPELKGKYILPETDNDLLSLQTLTTLWSKHLSQSQPDRTSYEYIGCMYLLGKRMEPFKEFLLQTLPLPVSNPLPVHFQEAALVAFAGDKAALDTIPVEASIRERYDDFVKQAERQMNQPNGITNMYEAFGNTFWFYYNYKKLEK